MAQYSGVWNISHIAQANKAQNWTGIVPPVVVYIVVAAGGGGGTDNGGAGGGAGGFLAGLATITPSILNFVIHF
jgi:hypothetical protein